MCKTPTAIDLRLILLTFCLAWNCPIRVVAQAPSPPAHGIGSEPVNFRNASEPRLSSDYPPDKRFELFDSVGPAGEECTDAEAGLSPITTAPQPRPFGAPCISRPKLTGDWWCVREQLRDCGYTLDISTTEYYQGVATGGLQETFRFGGRNDYILNVDGQKAGLWKGFSINLHGETVYGDSVNLFTGAVVPVNIGRSLPVVDGDVSALTAVKFSQALSENLILFAGKINTVDNVQQPFMPGRGLDAGFMNGAFLYSPVLGRTIPYSTFGAGAAILARGYPVVTLTVYDTNDASTQERFRSSI
jgi:porin